MNYKMIGRFMALIFALEALFMLPAYAIALHDGDTGARIAFLISGAAILALSGILFLLCRREKADGFYAKEGLICVGLSWIGISVLGALPFYISGCIPSFIDALFEIASGFTTTGASILAGVESFPRAILYWRSFSHWVGGMGVLVFLLAVTPIGRPGTGFTMHLMRAESPGPDVGKLSPRIRRTARSLYMIYILLTVLDITALNLCGLTPFESLCIAFGTAGTGGFAVTNAGLAGYPASAQVVTTVFMLLFSVNFTCWYLLLLGRVRSVLTDEELHMFLIIVFAAIALICWDVRNLFSSFGETLRYVSFQAATLVSTTGFSTINYDTWPGFSKAILLFLMFIGGCAGSTAGGLKVGRVLLLVKSLRRNARQVMNPRRVEAVRVNGRAIDDRVLANASSYLSAYVIILIASFVIISLDELSPYSNFSAVVACLNNVGPGFGSVGPICNYANYSDLSKLVLTADMLLGRLEIFPMLMLLSRYTWRQHRRPVSLRFR